MSKSPDAFRTISEVAEWLGIPAHVLRFWESKFTQIKPVKRAGGRRYYRPSDMLLLGGIKRLLHDEGQSIKQVQALLRDKGAAHVADMSSSLEENSDPMPVVDPEEVMEPFTKPKPSVPEQMDMNLDDPDDPAPESEPQFEPSEDALTAEDESLTFPQPETEELHNGVSNGIADSAPSPLVVDVEDVADDAFIVDRLGVLAQLANIKELSQSSQAEALICFDELRALSSRESNISANS